jgi:general secretion pathway protein D
MRRWGKIVLCVGIALGAAGCPKGGGEYGKARKAEDLQDLDTALQYYQKAYNSDPRNAAYRIKLNQIRFEAGAFHIKQGQKLREKGDLQAAVGEFQRATTIDPSSDAANQELSRTLQLIAEKNRQTDAQASPEAEDTSSMYAAAPPELKPLSRAPINLKASDDAKVIFNTIGKLAGVDVIFDSDFVARRINVEFNNVSLEQALEIACIQSKAWWKPVTENVIFIIQDTAQKHRDYDEKVVKTFYLSNVTQPQDLTDIANGLRQVAEISKIQQLNSQNAIIVRDTPDKIAIAEKLINDIDKARPEVVVQVEVLSASTDRLRDLGVLTGQSASLQFNPPTTTTNNNNNNGSGSTTTSNPLSLKGFHFSTADYSVTLPGATANFILTDTATRIIQNPEIRSVDGQSARLRIGSRVPIATGSFQAGVGVGTNAVNPLVNTQFTYLDVGVNVDITPHVHPNHEVSMKVMVEVSQVTGQATIGGIQQPIIGSNKIEHDIRLREGETAVLGGLFQQIDSSTLNGIPGLSQIPIMQYLVSDKKKDHQESDVLIVLTPRIVRLPDWTKANLRSIYAGSETNVQVKRESEIRTPTAPAPAQAAPAPNPNAAMAPASAGATNPAAAPDATAPRVRFEPGTLNLKAGQTAVVGIAVDNVTDLFAIPMMVQYDPAVISVEEVQHGAFLSGGNQEIAIVQRVDAEHGQAIISATRQPNTPGVSGSGTLLGLVVKAKAPGNAKLSIVQVNAIDSQHKVIPLVTGEATVQVQP